METSASLTCGWSVWSVAVVDQPSFNEYHVDTMNVTRRWTADTSPPPPQSDSNLQVTSSYRADGRSLVPLSSHVHGLREREHGQ